MYLSDFQHEIHTLNNPSFKENANWLQMLTQLIEDHQDYTGEEARAILQIWMNEKNLLRYGFV